MSGCQTGAGQVVTFDYVLWVTRYAELNTVPAALAQLYFNEAQLYLNNQPWSPVIDGSAGGQRALLLNMLVSHIAFLNMSGSSPLVGRISNASEGSVNVTAEYAESITDSEAWFVQTKYGAAYWAATAVYRMGQFVPRPYCGPTPVFYPSLNTYGLPYRGW
jgi:hypothetical protein